jgi:glycosyltransferase involved in cell wall biosynthesis
VAQGAAVYFSDAASFGACVEQLLTSPETLATLRANSKRRFFEEFTWEHVAGQYEQLLLRYLPK